LQFSSTLRARHIKWHRLGGRIFVICGMVIGVSALVMSFAMPAIGGINQAAATATLRHVLSARAGQGVLAYLAA